ncbi:4-O-methyltransferase 1 [Hypsizygus marmoreus]|uniref:4-O-methyltransferase 1 n=1 Tax=Hypsizygus marmoreus TaxID=39966 RepID=A0A369JBV2_HYPMA|nr:4-O-methyltransferase 1 [Hypsizygus marmoreus]
MSATSPLRALANSILASIDTIEAIYSKHGVPIPSLDEQFTLKATDSDPALADASRLIATAATQLIATVRQPMETLQDYTLGLYTTAALGFVVDANVPNILKDAGAQGLHTKDIAAINGVDPVKLGRILRYLAARHVFKEVTANVYANNLISSLLLKAETLDDIKANPASQYGAAAFIGHVADEGLKSSTALSSFLRDSKGVNAPFNMALNEPGTVWEWYGKPENAVRNQRFTEAMKGGAFRYPSDIFTGALDWAGLAPESVVVDIGANVGAVTLVLAKAFPNLRFIVQDLEKVVPDAQKFWEAMSPKDLADGRVKMQIHDFFNPQPVKGAAVYFMRFVIHDWPDAESIKILKRVRDAASPSSKLILFEFTVPHAFRAAPEANDPHHALILPAGIEWATSIDIQMLNLFNAQERTLDEFTALGKGSGWKLESYNAGQPLSTLVFSVA